MKKVLLLSLLTVVAVLSLACDNGKGYGVPSDAKVVTYIEREISGDSNSAVKIFAAKFSEDEDHLLRFVCPCYLGDDSVNESLSPVFSVAGQDEIVIELLSNASYNVYVRYLNIGQEINYKIPRNNKK